MYGQLIKIHLFPPFIHSVSLSLFCLTKACKSWPQREASVAKLEPSHPNRNQLTAFKELLNGGEGKAMAALHSRDN